MKLTLKKLRELGTIDVKRTMEQLSVDEMRKKLITWLEENCLDISKLEENDRQFTYESQFWLKPLSPDILHGKVTFRSRDYIFTYEKDGKFHNSYGEIKASDLTDNGWTVTMFNGNKINYEVLL